jgi:hypothetical protein
VTVTDNTSSSATWYPTFLSTTTGNLPITVSSTKLQYVPSTGVLTATGFSGSGASLTGTAASLTAGKVQYALTAGTNITFSTGTTYDGSAAITINATSGGGGSGTVTSVAATVPSFLSVTGSPITTSGTLAISYSGTALPVANGGSGATTAQSAMNTFAGAVTSGSYLRGNGTNVVMSTIQAADVPTLNQNTTGQAGKVANALTAGTNITFSTGTTYDGSTAITINATGGGGAGNAYGWFISR